MHTLSNTSKSYKFCYGSSKCGLIVKIVNAQPDNQLLLTTMDIITLELEET